MTFIDEAVKSPQRATQSYLFAAISATLFFIVGLFTLPGYGYTWDTPENLLTGAHTANFFATGNHEWLDFAAYDAHYQNKTIPPPPFYNQEFNHPERYPPLANVTAVFTHALFTDQLQLLADPDGYHLGVLLFATLAVFVLACFLWQAFHPVAAIAAVLALITYPLFFEHSHNNLKDIPFAALVLTALWLFWRSQHGHYWRWIGLSAIATGCALGVRILAMEIWGIVVLAHLPALWAQRSEGWRQALRPLRGLLLHVPLALFVFLLSWPWLWADPINRLASHLAFGQIAFDGARVLYAGQIYLSGETLPWHYTAVIFLLTTPPLVLLGGVGGVWQALQRSWREQHQAALMLVSLFGVALLRTSLPQIPQYDGIRHMFDGLLAFVGLFGVGTAVFYHWLQQWRPIQERVFALALALCFLPTAGWLVRLHPFQGIYYNVLAGGVTAVYGQYPQAYWGSSFRLASAWICPNIEPDAVILPRVGGHLLQYYATCEQKIIADEDLFFLPPEQQVYVVYLTRLDKFDWVVDFTETSLAPIYQIVRAEVPIIKIVQTDVGTLRTGPQ